VGPCWRCGVVCEDKDMSGVLKDGLCEDCTRDFGEGEARWFRLIKESVKQAINETVHL
jgi:hypothetical protein